MAQFRGTIQGGRGSASRLGTKASGLTVEGYGWGGGARVSLWYDSANDCDMIEVELIAHPSEGGQTFSLFRGSVEESRDAAVARYAEAVDA